MSGRGCVITIQVLGGANRDNDHEISLPVAVHSPLDVLKKQLAELTGIQSTNTTTNVTANTTTNPTTNTTTNTNTST